jgi:hypothetical protein
LRSGSPGTTHRQNGTGYGDARVLLVADSYKAWIDPTAVKSGTHAVDLEHVSLQ